MIAFDHYLTQYLIAFGAGPGVKRRTQLFFVFRFAPKVSERYSCAARIY